MFKRSGIFVLGVKIALALGNDFYIDGGKHGASG